MTKSMKAILVSALATASILGAAMSAPAAANSFMAFAVDMKGNVGHGKSPNRATARNFALSYCGAQGCRVVDVTKARCHALAHSFRNGYWYGTGTAGDMGTAMGFALDFCAQNAPASSCKIAYKHCQ